MLNPDELREACHEAEKAAVGCTRFCRVVAEYSDDQRYRLGHNGVGSRDTDIQVIHASGVLGLGKEAFAKKLTSWIDGLHAGQRIDLNAAMATGGMIVGAPYLVGEQIDYIRVDQKLDPVLRGPAMTGWPWHWNPGATP